MEIIYIALLIIINGQAQLLPGAPAVPMPSMEVCEERRKDLNEALKQVNNPNMPWATVCGTKKEIIHFIDVLNSEEA